MRRHLHRLLGRPGSQRKLLRVLPALLLPLLALQGCTLPLFLDHQTLQVVVVPVDGLEWMGRDYAGMAQWDTLLSAFRRLQPGVRVEISLLDETALETGLKRSTERGLAPDLLLLRAPQANSLLARGLVAPLPQQDPTIRRAVSLVSPRILERVSAPQGLSGLPVFTEATLACYDRRQLAQPPATLNDLLTIAAAGRPVGLAVDPFGVWWTVGALGAQDAMVPILTGQGLASRVDPRSDSQQLISWLRWLRVAAIQSNVEIAAGSRDLAAGLEAGRLAWIPCLSLLRHRFEKTLGSRLGMAPLPSGPGGEATPFATTRVWSLGRNSSPRQRQLAQQFAALSLDPILQRDAMIKFGTFLTANRFVPIPSASSSRLAALAGANAQFDRASPLLTSFLLLDRIRQIAPQMETVLTEVMAGVITPEQGAESLLRLRPDRR